MGGGLLLSVVIVNYRQGQETSRLVRLLSEAEAVRRGQAQILIIDNGSFSATDLEAMARLPSVVYQPLPENVGFGRAVNVAARLTRSEWLLLLNPDVRVNVGFLDAAIGYLQRASPRDGVVGLRLRDPLGQTQPSAGTAPTFLDTILGPLRPRVRRRCNLSINARRKKVPWVSGCGMFVRRSCFDEIGGFDPEYFLYYEDVDLSRRASAAGWNIVCDPQLAIIHDHPLHTRPLPPRMRLLTRQALLTYAHKHWSNAAAAILALIVGVEAWVRGMLVPRNSAERRAFEQLRRLAWDCLLGQRQRAYLRAWTMAQGGEKDVRAD